MTSKIFNGATVAKLHRDAMKVADDAKRIEILDIINSAEGERKVGEGYWVLRSTMAFLAKGTAVAGWFEARGIIE